MILAIRLMQERALAANSKVEVACRFLTFLWNAMSGGDATQVLEPIETSLGAVAHCVEEVVDGDLRQPILLTQNDGFGYAFSLSSQIE